MARFEDIVGQEHLIEYLRKAVNGGEVSHAYIIEGEMRSGKEFIAKVFSEALLCEGESDKPCGKCQSCLQMENNAHPDFYSIVHDKPSIISVKDIRDQVVKGISTRPFKSRYKIYLINEAEIMTEEAQNALLKTLEEPPEYVVIILLTTSKDKLLPTIQSRCVKLSLRPVDKKILKKYLMKEYKIPDYKADIAVSFSQGNFGKAKMLIINEDFDKMKTEAVSLLKHINDMDAPDIMAAIYKIKEYKYDEIDYLDIFSVWYRDVLLFKATNDINDLVFKQEIKHIKAVAKRTSYEGIDEIVRALEKTKTRIKAKANFETCMTLLLEVIRETR
ncbi:MAG: DNA polymerase III subunit delta' [Lachnospiraceae bacterium]|nr:DNA polymerase III subunit delta' [Lachnospiraceae bacterium]